ncbi:MAG TPA: hypothetical protein VIT23_18075, partial [Terrimicrobiaceae bacterium]
MSLNLLRCVNSSDRLDHTLAAFFPWCMDLPEELIDLHAAPQEQLERIAGEHLESVRSPDSRRRLAPQQDPQKIS